MFKYLIVINAILHSIIIIANSEPQLDLYHECAKFYHPGNYMNHLPSLNLPYTGDVPIPINVGLTGVGVNGEELTGPEASSEFNQLANPGNLMVPGQIGVPGLRIPNNPAIQPSPTYKTKAIQFVTKYVYKNPVCVKFSKGKNMCKKDTKGQFKEGLDTLITKEYFVNDRGSDDRNNQKTRRILDEGLFDSIKEPESDENINFNYIDLHLQSSESPRPFTKNVKKTPNLTRQKVHEMLIEDRLNQLETILPHYTRRRVYETSTITITKVVSNKRNMATLVVKNCIPYGYDLCESQSGNNLRRRSKVARLSNNTGEHGFYFG